MNEIDAELAAETSEQSQEMRSRSDTDPLEVLREQGAVLRLPEGPEVDTRDFNVEVAEDDTMILNMGPQHPSTHGVLRLLLELEAETVLRTKQIIRYMHPGM